MRKLFDCGPATLAYDRLNRLTQYTAGSTNLSFAYDALGNRIAKTANSVTTKYIGGLVETNASGAITAYYVYGLGLISKIEGSSAYYYQYDGLGSTVAVTDTAGAIKNKYAYDDFGRLATNSSEAIATPFKYVGKYGVQTDAPDLLYMRARYYMPSIGRFINKDPIGLAAGINKYWYSLNNPINFIDPSGYLSETGGVGYTAKDFKEGVKKISEGIQGKWYKSKCEADIIARDIMKEMTAIEGIKLKGLEKRGDVAGIERLLSGIYNRIKNRSSLESCKKECP